MNIKYQNTMIITSILWLFLGVSFILLENIFYQYIDKDGVLHESFFMPLGFLSIFIGLFFLLVIAIRTLLSKKQSLNSGKV